MSWPIVSNSSSLPPSLSSRSPLIAPSLLSADFANLSSEIRAITLAGASGLHVDVMDGHFVPNLTLGPPIVSSLRKVTDLHLDVHLMIENPGAYVEPFIQAGANGLTLHIETCPPDPRPLLKKIRQMGCQVGLTLRPSTDLGRILPFLPEVDLVLVMTVEPGFSGQKFMKDQVSKIDRLYELRETSKGKTNPLSYLIQVDGGVCLETAPLCHRADILVAGHFIFHHHDYRQAMDQLRSAHASYLHSLGDTYVTAPSQIPTPPPLPKPKPAQATTKDTDRDQNQTPATTPTSRSDGRGP